MAHWPIKIRTIAPSILMFGAAVLVFGSSFCPPAANAKELCSIHDPYKNGQYANEILRFTAGYYVRLRQWGQIREHTALHPSRLIHPARLVLGCPKRNLETSLTLGHGGSVVLSANKCFRAGKGPDIIIHEPRSEFNVTETFNVYVTTDRTGRGPWIQIAHNKSVNRDNNFLALDLDLIKDAAGHEVSLFRWLKIEDADSKSVLSDMRFSGFDVSSVKFMHQCDVPIS